MSAPSTLLRFYHAREVAGYYPAGVQGTVLGIPVGSDCASRRGAVSRGSVHSRPEKRVGVGSGV